MTVSELHKQLEALIKQGYGDAHVIRLEDFEDHHPYSYGVYPPREFSDQTIFGNPFPSASKQFVFLDIDVRVQNLHEGYEDNDE